MMCGAVLSWQKFVCMDGSYITNNYLTKFFTQIMNSIPLSSQYTRWYIVVYYKYYVTYMYIYIYIYIYAAKAVYYVKSIKFIVFASQPFLHGMCS